MVRSMIVMVVDPEDPKHGEITVVDDAAAAAHMAEALLEGGVDQERVRIFSASEVKMSVAHRPVVTLFGSDGSGGGREENPEGDQNVGCSGASSPEGEASGEPPAEGEEPEPFVQNGVRFSSLFRSS